MWVFFLHCAGHEVDLIHLEIYGHQLREIICSWAIKGKMSKILDSD